MFKSKKRLVILCCCLSFVILFPSGTAKAKRSLPLGVIKYQNIADFYKEKVNSIDILCLGDSNTYRGINPKIFWKNEHVTSYALASAAQTPSLSLHLLKDALNYQKPKVLLLDANLLFANTKGMKERNARLINSMKAGEERLSAIRDKTIDFTKKERSVLTAAYTRDMYIDNVNKTFRLSEKETPSVTKGYILNITKIPYANSIDYMYHNKRVNSLPEENAKPIRAILELCKKRNIEVILIRIPAAKEWSVSKSNYANAFANEAGIEYIDFNTKPYANTIDWYHDSKDGGGHLNVFGADKVSTITASYIMKNYDIQNTYSDDVIQNYNKSTKLFDKKEQEMIAEQTIGDVYF